MSHPRAIPCLALLASFTAMSLSVHCGSDPSPTANVGDGGNLSDTTTTGSDGAAVQLRSCGNWLGQPLPADLLGSSGWQDMSIQDGVATLVGESSAPEPFGAKTVTPADKDGVFVELNLTSLTPQFAWVSGLPGTDTLLLGSRSGADRYLAGYESETSDGGSFTSRVTLERRSAIDHTLVWKKTWANVGSLDQLAFLDGGDLLLAGSQANPGPKKFDSFTTEGKSVWAVRIGAADGSVKWAKSFGSTGTATAIAAHAIGPDEVQIVAQVRASGSFSGDLMLQGLSMVDGSPTKTFFFNGSATSSVLPGYHPGGALSLDPGRLVAFGSLRGTLGSGDTIVDAGAKTIQAIAAAFDTRDGGMLWNALASNGKNTSDDTRFVHGARINDSILLCRSSLACEVRALDTGALGRAFSFPKGLGNIQVIRVSGGKYYLAGATDAVDGPSGKERRRVLHCFEE